VDKVSFQFQIKAKMDVKLLMDKIISARIPPKIIHQNTLFGEFAISPQLGLFCIENSVRVKNPQKHLFKVDLSSESD